MIEENYLSEVIALYLLASGKVPWLFFVWVNVNHLSITLVSEKEAFFTVSLNTEVRAFVYHGDAGHPVEVAQIAFLQLEGFVAAENLCEVFQLHSVSKVNIGAFLVFVIFHVTDEEDAGSPAVSKSFLSFLKSF